MKKNRVYRLACLLLAAAMILPMGVSAASIKKTDKKEETKETEPVEVQEEVTYQEISISSAQELAALVQRCRLDSASKNLKITLTQNISLTEYPNLEIPTFGGIFDGGNHKITGFSIDAEGSAQGLFRYIQKGGVVRNLEVVGRVLPTGSACQIGGIAGVNEGTIENVAFSGTLEGVNRLGGIVGTNTVSGKVLSCTSTGYIRGTKVIGGVAGENKGVIKNCVNKSSVNTEVPDDSLSLEDISVTKIISEETVISGSDIGGVVGFSSGVVRLCRNEGNVGYQHTGYNVGGVVGSSSGFMADCVNYGAVQARKEGGGVLGQMEPNNVLEYSEDTLQKLDKELQATSSILNQMSADASSINSSLKKKAADVEYNVNAFVGSIYYLMSLLDSGSSIPVTYADMDDDFGYPSLDFGNLEEIWAAAGDVGNNLGDVVHSIGSLSDALTDEGGTIITDIQSLTNQISRVVNVLSGREENENLTEDVSGQNVEQDSAGKIRNCLNYGTVDADINAGGIVGALSVENDLDPEDDLSKVGDSSLNFSLKTRALVYKCVNRGTVQAKKQVAGGIAGQSTLGAVISCENYGVVDSEDASWVGGIVGISEAEVSNCWAKCGLIGSSLVGGIVGEGTDVENCRALVTIDCDGEYVGAIAGKMEEDATATGNYFVDSDTLGGIDGISYGGVAEPMSYNHFMKLADVPDAYQKMVLTFIADDATFTRRVDYNGTLKDIPEVPKKEGSNGVWKDLKTEQIRADQRIFVEYTDLQGSAATGETGQPVALAEGSFPEGENVTAESLSDGLPGSCQFGWTLTIPDDGQASHTIHLKKPDKTKDYKVYVNLNDSWQKVDTTEDGSYLVFDAEGNTFQVAVQKVANYTWLWICLGAVAAVLVLGAVLVVYKKKKKAKAKKN